MPWFRVDDGFAFHPKTIRATNAALGLWVRAGSWCGANMTAGRLPAGMVGTLGGHKRDARSLVDAGLWIETADGYQFKDWDLYQPTKEQVEADRAAARARQKAFRDRHRNGVTNGVTDAESNGVSNGSPSLPVPSRPEVPSELLSVPTPADGRTTTRRKPERPLPASWAPNAQHHETAIAKRLDMAEQVMRFRNHADTHDRRARDWDAAFRTWLNRAEPGATSGTSFWDMKVAGE